MLERKEDNKEEKEVSFQAPAAEKEEEEDFTFLVSDPEPSAASSARQASVVSPAAPAVEEEEVVPQFLDTSFDDAAAAVEALTITPMPSVAPKDAPNNEEEPSIQRSEPLKRNVSFGRPTGSLSSEPSRDSLAESSWKRAASAPAAPRLRYSRSEIVGLFTKGQPVPPEIKAIYPDAFESGPVVAGPSRGALSRTSSSNSNSGRDGGSGSSRRGSAMSREGSHRFSTPSPQPSAEELAMFAPGRENVFKFQPTLLKDGTDPEVVAKRANLVLNKLSVEKFDKLSDEFMMTGIEREDVMDRAVDLIVSKAQMEETFSFMYAKLCKKIIDDWTSKYEGAEKNPGSEFRYFYPFSPMRIKM